MGIDDAGAPDAGEREVEARLALALARFAERLDGRDRATVRARIVEQVAQATALRAVPLQAGDEPDLLFAPFRAGREAER